MIRSGAFIAGAGAAIWLARNAFVLIFFLASFRSISADLVGPAGIDSLGALLLTRPILLADVIAATLFAAGLITFQRGTAGLSWRDYEHDATRSVDETARDRAVDAGLLLFLFAGLDFLIGFAVLGRTEILVAFLVASALLYAGVVLFGSFATRFSADVGNHRALSGSGLQAYAGAIVIGAAIAVAVLLGVGPNLPSGPDAAAAFAATLPYVAVTTFAFVFVVAPIIGVLSFRSVATRLFRLVAFRPEVSPPWPAIGAERPGALIGRKPMPSSSSGVSAAAPPVLGRPLEEGWVSGLQSRVQELEGRMREYETLASRLRTLPGEGAFENVPPADIEPTLPGIPASEMPAPSETKERKQREKRRDDALPREGTG